MTSKTIWPQSLRDRLVRSEVCSAAATTMFNSVRAGIARDYGRHLGLRMSREAWNSYYVSWVLPRNASWVPRINQVVSRLTEVGLTGLMITREYDLRY